MLKLNKIEWEVIFMFAIIAMLSDIPYYIAALVEKLTGSDMSSFLDVFNKGFAGLIELAEKALGQL